MSWETSFRFLMFAGVAGIVALIWCAVGFAVAEFIRWVRE